jgi:hypothetical protein
MTDRDDENMVDPPDNQGGGGKTEMDSPSDEASRTADPPSTDGGTKG